MAQEIEDLKSRVRSLEADTRVLKTSHQLLTDQMADLAIQSDDMTRNLEKVIESSLDKAVTKFFAEAQRQAAEKTGLWIWSAVKAVATKWMVIAFVVLTVGKYAGWQVAVQVFDWLKGK